MTKKRARLDRLLAAVESKTMVHLKEAALMLGVSEMTVRRDIADSGGRFGLAGGYVVADRDFSPYALDREQDQHRHAKIAACDHALGLIEPEDTLFIDCGTTLVHLATHLPHDARLTVVAYALNIAEAVARHPGVRLIMIGGLYHPASASFSGEDAAATFARVRINKAFITAGGVHPVQGLSCSNSHEVAVKQAARAGALNSYLVINSSKFGRVKPMFFADCADYPVVISETGPASLEQALTSLEQALTSALPSRQ